MSKLLVGLNARQVAVVLHDKGPLRVTAVAGSGKTRSLVHRVAYLVEERQVDPRRLLAMTFTKRAAEEMNVRLRRMLKKTTARIGTFHSVALEILRENGLRGEVDGEGAKFRELVQATVGHKGMNWKEADLTVVLDYIAACKAHVELPNTPEARARANRWALGGYAGLLHDAYVLIEDRRKRQQISTFDDLLVEAVLLLETGYGAYRYDYVLADEFQDTNPAQVRIARAFAREHSNYMVVGDGWQCVYGFRSADPKVLARFHEEWPGTVDIVMNSNYRSGSSIVAVANGLLAHAGADYEILAERPVRGRVELQAYESPWEEAQGVVMSMREIRQDGVNWGMMAVLYRMHAQSREIEDALVHAKIPYVISGGGAFYRRQEVVALLSYLRAADPDASWEDVKPSLRVPFRYLGKEFFQRCEEQASSARKLGWPEYLREQADGWLDPTARAWIEAALRGNVGLWARVVEQVRRNAGMKPASLLSLVLDETNFIKELVLAHGTEGPENIHESNVADLLDLAGKYETVSGLLAYVDEMSSQISQARGETGDRVVLSSIHASKGLEWNHVWVISCNEGIMPHERSLETKEALAEEGRLAYVAFTRARDDLYPSWVRCSLVGSRPGRPSRFLKQAGLIVGDGDGERR